jgi:hypothetical protein
LKTKKAIKLHIVGDASKKTSHFSIRFSSIS